MWKEIWHVSGQFLDLELLLKMRHVSGQLLELNIFENECVDLDFFENKACLRAVPGVSNFFEKDACLRAYYISYRRAYKLTPRALLRYIYVVFFKLLYSSR